MCYASGSIEQVTRTCIMCKVYPPRQVSCPHQPLGICRNRQNHPRFDVLYFRSAELSLFIGCGYCKWAAIHASLSPPPSDKTWFNSGWPGCCRAPKPSEYSFVKTLAEWLAVNKIHGTPIPPDAGQGLTPNGSIKALGSPKKDQPRPSLANVLCGLEKEREPFVAPVASTSNGHNIPPSLRRRRSKSVTQVVERDLDAVSRVSTSARNSTSQNNSVIVMENKTSTLQAPSRTTRRSVETSLTQSVQNNLGLLTPPIVRAPSNSTSSSGSGSSATGSVTTVTSEGFTDYLSDESDQELQRQAEARAAELAIAKHEKDEFDAALQTVRHLSLQPPPEWNAQLQVNRSARYHRETFPGPQPMPVAVAHSRH